MRGSPPFEPPAIAADRESKFTLPAGRIPLARRWLDVVCRPDPDHPAADVWTLYYDTQRFSALGEKIDSDYLKLKVRVRWYSEPGRPASGPVFVEAKLRAGTLRSKVRVEAPLDAAEMARRDLQDSRLVELPLLLRAHGIMLRAAWFPLLVVRYRRDRFVEPTGSVRLNLDSGITAAAVNRQRISATNLRPIDRGVLELKGGSSELTGPLKPLLHLGLRKESFSKLLAVYSGVTRRLP